MAASELFTFLVICFFCQGSSQALVRVAKNQPLSGLQVSITPLRADENNMAGVSEYAQMGTIVAHVDVQNLGTDDSSFFCAIQPPSSVFQLQKLDNRSYQIVLFDQLDREFQYLHTVRVECRGNINPDSVGNAILDVRVLDENDNPPVFEESYISVAVLEDTTPGSFIALVVAADRDYGENAEFRYRLGGDPYHRVFGVNETTGIIYLKEPLDRELINQFFLYVEAQDMGVPPLTGVMNVEVNVVDINDNPPYFTRNEYTFFIPGNEVREGQIVGQVTARDSDVGPNGNVDIFFSEGSQAARDLFSVSTTGSISISQTVSHQDLGSANHTFSVVARDHGQPILSSTATVHIEVMDPSVV